MLIEDKSPNAGGGSLPAASLRNRLFAYLLDRLFVLPFSLGMVYVVVYLKSLPLALLCILGDALYKPILEGMYGYTWGKKLMHLKVVNREDQVPITWNQSLLRYTPWAIAVYASIFVMVRYFQTPELMDVTDMQAYIEFMGDHPLSNNFLIVKFQSRHTAALNLLSLTIIVNLH